MPGPYQAVLARYDAAGQKQWMHIFAPSDSGPSDGNSVAADANGHVYLVGATSGTLGATPLAGTQTLFVMQCDAMGRPLWTRQPQSDYDDRAMTVTTDASGDVYAAVVSNALHDDYLGFDALLVKYDANGQELWRNALRTNVDDHANALATDSHGNIYLAGDTGGVLDGDRNAGSTDAFVAQFDPSVARIWTRQFGGEGEDRAVGIAVDPSGNLFVAGYSQQGGIDRQSGADDWDSFVMKLDPDGHEL